MLELAVAFESVVELELVAAGLAQPDRAPKRSPGPQPNETSGARSRDLALDATPTSTLPARHKPSSRRYKCFSSTMSFARKNIRLPALNYRGRRRFFITLCCEHRRRFFTQNRLAAGIIEILRVTAIQHKIAFYTYCLMPDHLHALVIGLDPSSNCLNFMSDFKRKSTIEFQSEYSSPLWQKKFYDYILRPKDSTDRVAAYIWLNPVRKGLRSEQQDYAYSGSFAADWKPSLDLANPWTPAWKPAAQTQSP
ncbi:MAG: transposase [Candidatus Acidiferrales bacterium]